MGSIYSGQKNKLVFQNDPLEIIAKKMERWYNKTIIIENDNLRSEPFSGVFEEKIVAIS